MNVKNKNLLIVFLILLSALCLLSICIVIVSIVITVKLTESYPQPIDSFWSLRLSVTLLVVFSVCLAASVAGIVFIGMKLRA